MMVEEHDVARSFRIWSTRGESTLEIELVVLEESVRTRAQSGLGYDAADVLHASVGFCGAALSKKESCLVIVEFMLM
jgi:hypothetical protein